MPQEKKKRKPKLSSIEQAGRHSVLSENFRRRRSIPEPTKVVKDNEVKNEDEKDKEDHQE